jgi:hypothetical protein
MIYAYGETNIAITGKGTIDSQASYENWWVRKGLSPETAITQNAARARQLEITCKKSKFGILLTGYEDSVNISMYI